jgi:hypothetical protein
MKRSINIRLVSIVLCAIVTVSSSCTQSHDDSHNQLSALAALISAPKSSSTESANTDSASELARCGVLCPSPAITSITPAYASTSVVTNSSIAISFNQAMLASSLSTSSIVVTNAYGQVIPGTISYNPYSYVCTYMPATALAAYSTYYVRVAANLMTTTGYMLGSPYQSQFTTGPAYIANPPAIVNITPATSATSIATNTSIAIAFNQAMLASSLNTSNIIVTNAYGQVVPGNLSYNPNTYMATYMPTAGLAAYTPYNVQIASNVMSSAGVSLTSAYQSSFTTGATYPAYASPAIVSVTPTTSAVSIATNTSIAIAFNQAMLASSLNTSSIVLVNAYGQVVPCSISYNPNTYVATFVPVTALSAYTSYNVQIASSVMSSMGVSLTSSFQSSFTTGAAYYGSYAPAIVSVTPTTSAVSIATNTSIAIAFNQAMLASSLNTSSIVLVNAYGQVVPCSISYNPNTYVATFVPVVALSPYTAYNVQIGSSVMSSVGVSLTSSFQSSFTTGAALVTSTPAIVSITPSAYSSTVSLNSSIAIAFNQAMYASSLTSSSIVVTNAYGQYVPCLVSYNPMTYVATLTPTVSFAASSTYYVNVGANVQSYAGAALTSPFQSQFTTAWY